MFSTSARDSDQFKRTRPRLQLSREKRQRNALAAVSNMPGHCTLMLAVAVLLAGLESGVSDRVAAFAGGFPRARLRTRDQH